VAPSHVASFARATPKPLARSPVTADGMGLTGPCADAFQANEPSLCSAEGPGA
jgi:hypothetical protein